MNTNVSVFLAGMLLTIALMMPAPAAAADGGFYVGAGLGNAKIEIDLADAQLPGLDDFDESDMGYKLFGGYNWRLSSFILGLEAGYTDFGKPSMSLEGQSLGIAPSGFNIWGVAGFAAGPVDIYGKFGSLQWDVDITGGGESESVDGSDTGYGLGLGFHAGNFTIRGEYEIYEIDSDADLTMFTLGVAYNF